MGWIHAHCVQLRSTHSCVSTCSPEHEGLVGAEAEHSGMARNLLSRFWACLVNNGTESTADFPLRKKD